MRQLAELASLLNQDTSDCGLLLEAALPLVCDMFGARAAWIFACRDGDGHELVAAHGVDPREWELLGTGSCHCQELQRQGALTEGSNMNRCQRFAGPEADACAPRYHASVPVPIDGAGDALLNLRYPNERPFDDGELCVVSTVANLLGTAISRCRSGASALAEQQRTAELYTNLLDHSPAAVMAVDFNDRVVCWNVHAERLFGLSRAEVLGRKVEELPLARPGGSERSRIAQTLAERGTWEGVFTYGRGIQQVPLRAKMSYLTCPEAQFTGFVATFVDDTERLATEERLAALAVTDLLTGLPNRSALMEDLSGDASPAAVLYLDVDRFRVVSDSVGPVVGDLLLSEIAAKLEEAAGPGALYRLGGDDFVVLVRDPACADVSALAVRLQQAARGPFPHAELHHSFTLSIGIAQARSDVTADQELLRDAETALHEARRRGTGRIQVFEEQTREEVVRRFTMEHRLRSAIESGDLELHYQPQVLLSDERVVGFEALLRWEVDGERVLPAEFVATAEETGLIVPMGTWVLNEACQEAARWRGASGRSVRMSVNVAGPQIQAPGFVDSVVAAIEQSGIEPTDLVLELTETAFVELGPELIDRCRELRELGVEFSVDDFGTGWSSLVYLRRLQPAEVKVDLSFVRGLPDDPNDCAIVRAIVGLGESLGVLVIAEGVENPRQRSWLEAAGCPRAQGFLWSRPMPAGDAFRFWQERDADDRAREPDRGGHD